MSSPQSFQQYLHLHEVTLSGGQSLDPKRFEKDLVRALNGVTGYSHFQSRAAEKLAHQIASSLKSFGFQGEAIHMSGKSHMSNLSSLYREYGVVNGEPKTDLLIGNVRCSMKYAKNAPIATALANETRAVFAATFASHPSYHRLVNEQFLPLIKHTLSSSMFQQLRAKYNQSNPTAFQNMLSKVIGFHSSQGSASARERANFRTFLAAVGIDVPLRRELYAFLDNPQTKRDVMLEFVSGRHRFVRPEHAASHLLRWDETGKVNCSPVEQYVAAHLSNFSYSIRAAHTSAALRIDLGEAIEDPLTEWVTELTDRIIQESAITDMWNIASDIGRLILAAAKAVIAFVVRVMRQGIVTVMDFFEYEVEGLSWTSTF
jgi:hypothetical protein